MTVWAPNEVLAAAAAALRRRYVLYCVVAVTVLLPFAPLAGWPSPHWVVFALLSMVLAAASDLAVVLMALSDAQPGHDSGGRRLAAVARALRPRALPLLNAAAGRWVLILGVSLLAMRVLTLAVYNSPLWRFVSDQAADPNRVAEGTVRVVSFVAARLTEALTFGAPLAVALGDAPDAPAAFRRSLALWRAARGAVLGVLVPAWLAHWMLGVALDDFLVRVAHASARAVELSGLALRAAALPVVGALTVAVYRYASDLTEGTERESSTERPPDVSPVTPPAT